MGIPVCCTLGVVWFITMYVLNMNSIIILNKSFCTMKNDFEWLNFVVSKWLSNNYFNENIKIPIYNLPIHYITHYYVLINIL